MQLYINKTPIYNYCCNILQPFVHITFIIILSIFSHNHVLSTRGIAVFPERKIEKGNKYLKCIVPIKILASPNSYLDKIYTKLHNILLES